MANTDIQMALANEARRSELRQKVASLRGGMDATASLLSRISSLNNDQQIQLTETLATLASFESGAGPGVTSDFGRKSTITQMVEAERFAAKAAVVDLVKLNPATTEDEAGVEWNRAGIETHPDFPFILQDAKTFSALYRVNLMAAGIIEQNTWEAQRDWICATPKEEILAM